MTFKDAKRIADLVAAADTDDGYESLTRLLRGLRKQWPDFDWFDLVAARHGNPRRWKYGGRTVS